MTLEEQLNKAKTKVAELEVKKQKLKQKNYEKIGVAACKQLNLDPLNLKAALEQIKQLHKDKADNLKQNN